NLRGASTDGQGRDFRSQVLVLVNGRRAGTANLSKLSPSDVERIEIVRGPSSVIYGSQAMGGVVNIIMKTGATAPGT
ncbi:TonB-dependent receptor plug domain-containing protein, partial [Rhizobium ruizarguesonis]